MAIPREIEAHLRRLFQHPPEAGWSHWKIMLGRLVLGKWRISGAMSIYVKLWGGYIVETSRDWMIFGISTAKKKNNDKGIADQFTPYGSSAHHNLFKIFLETCIDRNKRTWTSSQQLVSCFFSGPGTLCSVTALPRLEGLCYPTVAPGTLQLRKMSGNGIM